MIQVFDGDGELVVIETDGEFLARMGEHPSLSKPARAVCLCMLDGKGYSHTDVLIIHNGMTRSFPGMLDADRSRLQALAAHHLRPASMR